LTTIVYLIDTMTCDTAGTQRQLLETIRRLDRAEFAPHLVCLSDSDWLRTATLPCPLHVLAYRGFLKPGFPAVVERLKRLLAELGTDIVHTFFDESIIVAWLGTRGLRRPPVLLSSRRDMGLGAGNSPWYHQLFPAVLRLVNRDYDGIIANSETVRQHVASRERTPPDRITVLPNGVDLPADRSSVTEPTGRPTTVGIVASLTPVKRHDVLLRAFAALPDDEACRTARLLVIGDGPLRQELERLAAELGLGARVTFTGVTADVGQRLRQLDIGVLCSDREGLSNAILEYMAHGLPTVATDVGGNPELLAAGTGLIVPAGDVAALSAALARLIGDPAARRSLGSAASVRVRSQYSWPAAMGALTGYYRERLRGR
jgi:L-malate glycosyltransferase